MLRQVITHQKVPEIYHIITRVDKAHSVALPCYVSTIYANQGIMQHNTNILK